MKAAGRSVGPELEGSKPSRNGAATGASWAPRRMGIHLAVTAGGRRASSHGTAAMGGLCRGSARWEEFRRRERRAGVSREEPDAVPGPWPARGQLAGRRIRFTSNPRKVGALEIKSDFERTVHAAAGIAMLSRKSNECGSRDDKGTLHDRFRILK